MSSWFCVLPGHAFFKFHLLLNFSNNFLLFFFQTAFRFPLKLAISGVVSFIALYQVTTISTIRLHNGGQSETAHLSTL